MVSRTMDQIIKEFPQYYLDIAGVIIIAIDKVGIVRLVNKLGCEVLGCEEKEIIGEDWIANFIPEEYRKDLKGYFLELLNGELESKEEYENSIIDKKGQSRLVSWKNTIVYDDNKRALGIISSGIDITEQRNNQLILKESEQKYHALFDNMSNGFALHQIVTNDVGKPIDYIFLEVNDTFQELTGLKRKDIIGKKVTHAIPGIENVDFDWIGTFGKVALTGKKIRIEDQYSESLKRWYSINAYSHEKGIFATIFSDVTKMKKVEKDLLESNEQLSLSLKSGNQGVYYGNIQTGETEVSPEYATMLGYDPLNFRESVKLLIERMHPEDKDHSLEVLKDLSAGKITEHLTEFRLKTFAGDWKWILSTGKIVEFDAQRKPLRIVGTHTDINDLKITQIKLKESLEFTEAALNAQMDTFFVFDPVNGKANRWNKAFENISGYSADEISELKAPESYYSKVDLKKAKIVIDTVLKQGSGKVELTLITKDGRKVPTEYVVSTIEDEKGVPKYLISIGRDISERKKVELELKYKSEEIAIQNEEYLSLNNDLSEKVEQINRINKELSIEKDRAEESDYLKSAFLSNMSHEIRTPMNAILGFSKLMSRKQLSESKTKKYTEFIQNSGEQLLRIIDDIIDISKIESNQLRIEKKSCNVDELMNEIAASQRLISLMKKKINVKLNLNIPDNSKDLYMLTDPVRFGQVLSNLITNSFKFTEKGFVEIGCSVFRKESNNFLQFYVKDTGLGIPSEKFDTIFERFGQIRDKKVRGGTGLGLSITKGIIELLGGELWLDSEINKGSTFYFTHPLQENVPRKIFEESINKTYLIPDLSQKVAYIAEDDMISFLFIKEILKETKIKIIHAQHGLELIGFLKRRVPDIILLDINMPVMNGYDALVKIRKRYKNLPVIAQTAYAMSEEKEKCMALGANDYIIKPLDPELLIEKLVSHLKED